MSSSDDGVQTRAMENVRRVTQRHLPYDKRIQSYDEFADTFDEDLSSLGYELPTILGEILTNLFQGDKTNIRVLDVAAGTGLVGVKLHERGFTNIDALEPSTGMLDKAREKKVYTNLCNVPISEDPLDIAADSYNAVTSVGGFGGGMAPFGSVREMLRLVKPVLGYLAVAWAQIPKTCKTVAPCVCQDENGRYVDLTPLARTNGSPRYEDVPYTGGHAGTVYSYNPCVGFHEGPIDSPCSDVAVCHSYRGQSDFIDLGHQSTATFSHFDNGNLSVVYTSKDKKFQTIVVLYCPQDGKQGFYVHGGLGGGVTWFQLWTKYACPRDESELQDGSNTTEARASRPLTVKSTVVPNVTTPAPPHVVTMTARPGPAPSPGTMNIIVVLLGAILIVVVLILSVLAGSAAVNSARRRLFGTTVHYQPVPTEPQVYYDKMSGITV